MTRKLYITGDSKSAKAQKKRSSDFAHSPEGGGRIRCNATKRALNRLPGPIRAKLEENNNFITHPLDFTSCRCGFSFILQ